jgi:2-hydroxy fatty acid dioxygenase
MAKSPTWFENQFYFYAKYHQDETNKQIHLLCIWMIVWTALLFLAYSDDIVVSGIAMPAGHHFGWAFLIAAFYYVYYLLVELPGMAGPIASSVVVLAYFSAVHIRNTIPDAWKIGLVVHVFCWVAQIVGHQVFEGNAPAFMDNLFSAFVMAPLFVIMELMFMFGYKPAFYAKLNSRLRKKA